MRSHRRALLERLKEQPLLEVIGVVGANGPSGSHLFGELLWTLQLSFECWKFPGAELQTKPLQLIQQVAEQEVQRIQVRIAPYSVWRVRAHVSDRVADEGTPNALLVDLIGPDEEDVELINTARRLQEPVSFEDHQFGVFTLDPRVNWFESRAAWNEEPISLTLCVSNQDDVIGALSTARELWSRQREWHQQIVECCIRDLLALKNDSWLEPGEHEISADGFRQKLCLKTIAVGADSSFDFWFDDGGLFFGHSIRVRGNLSEGPDGAEIVG